MTSAQAANHPAGKAPPPAVRHDTATVQPSEVPEHGHEAFYAQPEFWVAVSFLIVVGFAARKVITAVTSALDMRSEKIKTRLEEAQSLREDAQGLLAEYQRKQRDALKEAEAIVVHAREEAQRHKREAAAELEEAIKRREAQAMIRIAQAEAQAMADVRNLAIDIAVGAAYRLIEQNLTDQQADALVERAIAELPASIRSLQ
ncbi:MAG: F0F1 ATP synthase subunit B [Alphaproteobacteria bacterium]|nr:F0F1 ATP synthase subunit B [Alphaproteobacteria bacterium]MBF0129932.1 F0F1 ATP synthase subunit B [Alphaproteobacteria bacterium]